jgi:hypothetical protein
MSYVDPSARVPQASAAISGGIQAVSAADRMSVFRDRRARGVKPYTVELSDEMLDEAERCGLVTKEERADRAALAKALGFVLEDVIEYQSSGAWLRRNGDD